MGFLYFILVACVGITGLTVENRRREFQEGIDKKIKRLKEHERNQRKIKKRRRKNRVKKD